MAGEFAARDRRRLLMIKYNQPDRGRIARRRNAGRILDDHDRLLALADLTQDRPVGRALAWQALNDTEALKSAVPGCESITPAGADAFDVVQLRPFFERVGKANPAADPDGMIWIETTGSSSLQGETYIDWRQIPPGASSLLLLPLVTDH